MPGLISSAVEPSARAAVEGNDGHGEYSILSRTISLAVFLALVTTAFALGSSFEAGEWYYQKVVGPSWTPPGWLFGPAWAVFYVLMAVAAWETWETGHVDRLGAMTWWVLLLGLLTVWSVLFFGLNRPGWAWLELTVALAAAVLSIRAFRPISRQGAYLMVPGLIWLVFFWVLQFFTWNMSGGPLNGYL